LNHLKKIIANHFKKDPHLVWILIHQIVSFLANFYLSIWLAKNLGISDLANYSLYMTIPALFSQFVISGVISSASRFYFPALSMNSLDTYFYIINSFYKKVLIFSFVVSFLTWFIFLKYSNLLIIGFYLLMFSLSSGFLNIYLTILNSMLLRKSFVLFALLELFLRLFGLVILTYLALSTIQNVFLVLMLSNLFTVSSIIYYFNRHHDVLFLTRNFSNTNKQLVKDFYKYARPILYGSFFSWAFVSSQRYIIDLTLSKEFLSSFFFNTQLATTPITIVSSVVISIASPILFKRFSDIDNISYKEVIRYLLNLFLFFLVIVVCYIGIGYLIYEKFIEVFLKDKSTLFSVRFFLILSSSALILGFSSILGLFFNVINLPKRLLALNTYGLLILISILYSCSYFYGTDGFLFSFLFISLIHFFWVALKVRHEIKSK
jgi:O-antigen/teichoic acid export membrane protein